MPSGVSGGRDSWANRQLNAAAAARAGDDVVCWLCGQPIEMWRDRKTDPLAYTADHVDPLFTGGDLLGARLPAHRRCNSRRGALDRHARDRRKRHPTSRAW